MSDRTFPATSGLVPLVEVNRTAVRHVAVVTDGGGMRTSGPVTVVVVGDCDDDLAELPDVRPLARADDPRRAPRLVGVARPQVVLAGL